MPDYELDPTETAIDLKLFADIQETGSVNVTLTADYLRQVSELIERLATDEIVINVGEGEEPVIFRGEQATEIIQHSVSAFINAALTKMVAEFKNLS